MPADAHDSCPQCGGRMAPVLDRSPAPADVGPLLHDSPVFLQCPACTEAGSLATGERRL